MNKENRKAAKERRAKEREHEAKVAHYKKIWSWAGPALIVVVIVGLIIASVLDSKRLSVKSASEDTSTASSASTSASASLQTDTSLTIEDGDTVNIDYVGSIDGVEFEGGNTKGNGADLVIGSHTYIDDFEERPSPGRHRRCNRHFPVRLWKRRTQWKGSSFQSYHQRHL